MVIFKVIFEFVGSEFLGFISSYFSLQNMYLHADLLNLLYSFGFAYQLLWISNAYKNISYSGL